MTTFHHRLFLVVLLSLISGIAIATLTNIPLLTAGIVFMSGLCGVVVGSRETEMRRHALLFVSVALVAVSAGMLRVNLPELWRGESIRREAALLASAATLRRPVRVGATVSSPTEAHPAYQRFVARTDAGNELLISAERTESFTYGDSITLEGRLRQTHEFDAARGIAYELFMPQITPMRRGHVFSLWRPLSLVRTAASGRLEQIFTEPLGAYAKALLLGDRSGFSRELVEVFRRAGTTHIIALSGFNIILIANFLSVLLLGLGMNRRASFWPVAIGITIFVLVTGASASVVRAGIMGILAPLAYAVGRRYDVTRALGAAAALMLLADPAILWHDIGFQLSFAAIIGMTTIGALLAARFAHWGNTLGLRDLALTTVAVEIMVLPLLVYHFGQVAVLSLVVNLLVLPLIPPTTVLGFLGLAGGAVFTALGKILATPAAILLSAELGIMEFFASLPFATVFFPPISFTALILVYGVMAVAIAVLSRHMRSTRHAAT